MQDQASGNDFGHQEKRDGSKTVGRYYVLLPDGRKQVDNRFKSTSLDYLKGNNNN